MNDILSCLCRAAGTFSSAVSRKHAQKRMVPRFCSSFSILFRLSPYTADTVAFLRHQLPSAILWTPLHGIPGYSLFSKGVYCSGGICCTFFLHPSGTATHFLPFWHSGAFSRLLHRALPMGILMVFPQCRHSDRPPGRKLPSLRAVDIPFMH